MDSEIYWKKLVPSLRINKIYCTNLIIATIGNLRRKDTGPKDARRANPIELKQTIETIPQGNTKFWMYRIYIYEVRGEKGFVY